MDQQLRHFHVVVETSQMQRGVSVILLLINNPWARQFGQQNLRMYSSIIIKCFIIITTITTIIVSS